MAQTVCIGDSVGIDTRAQESLYDLDHDAREKQRRDRLREELEKARLRDEERQREIEREAEQSRRKKKNEYKRKPLYLED